MKQGRWVEVVVQEVRVVRVVGRVPRVRRRAGGVVVAVVVF